MIQDMNAIKRYVKQRMKTVRLHIQVSTAIVVEQVLLRLVVIRVEVDKYCIITGKRLRIDRDVKMHRIVWCNRCQLLKPVRNNVLVIILIRDRKLHEHAVKVHFADILKCNTKVYGFTYLH